MRVISGGQTGADRTALEVARDLGIQTGGTVPKGWRTEKGADPTLAEFGCSEHSSAEYPPRTKANVLDSDATVWFGEVGSPGYRATMREVKAAKRPYLINPTGHQLFVFLQWLGVKTLNVAGNRASKNPQVVNQVRLVLTDALLKIGGMPR